MPDIALEPGSGAERFVLHLQAHPGEYDRHAVAALLAQWELALIAFVLAPILALVSERAC